MEDITEDHDETCHELPFTFPQVKPLYSCLRNSRYSSTRKPLKPLRCFILSESEENVHSENQEEIETAESNSLSSNSISGNLKPNCNIESNTSSENDEKGVRTDLRFLYLDPPHCSGLQTPFYARRLVKRVPNTYTPGKNDMKENDIGCGKDSKLMQKPTEKMKNEFFLKNNERQDKLHSENLEFGVADVPRKTSKIPNNKTSASDKNSKLVANKMYKSENIESLEKPKSQDAIFKTPEVEKPKEIIFNPSTNKPTVLHVNNIQYTVLSKIGQGGSSQVYQVLDTRTSTLLAVKCVSLMDADEVTAMSYLKEIEMLSKLQNSNRVVHLIDHEYLKQQQILYVVMEKGDTDLSTLLKQMVKSGNVSLPMIIYYWTEMLHCVKEIHSHGIVHADLKPANFLLVCGRLKLIDFGIASAIQNDATSIFKDSMHGTCNYMSPEAIQDPGDSSRTKVGYKSDVWSLGCILYNLLYRKTPFQHITNNLQKLKMIADPKHSIQFPPVEKCPSQLMAALKRCLIYNAKKRPTVAELLAIDYINSSNE